MIAQIKSKFTVYNYVFSADFNRNFPAMFTEAFRRFLIHLLTQRICGAKAWPTGKFPSAMATGNFIFAGDVVCNS